MMENVTLHFVGNIKYSVIGNCDCGRRKKRADGTYYTGTGFLIEVEGVRHSKCGQCQTEDAEIDALNQTITEMDTERDRVKQFGNEKERKGLMDDEKFSWRKKDFMNRINRIRDQRRAEITAAYEGAV
jgi:hypothetical protein